MKHLFELLAERHLAMATRLAEGVAVAIGGQIYQGHLRQPIAADSENFVLLRSAAGDNRLTQQGHLTLDGPIAPEQDGPSELLPNDSEEGAMVGSPKFETATGLDPSPSSSPSSSADVIVRGQPGGGAQSTGYFRAWPSTVASEYQATGDSVISRGVSRYIPTCRPGSLTQPCGTSDIGRARADLFAVICGN